MADTGLCAVALAMVLFLERWMSIPTENDLSLDPARVPERLSEASRQNPQRPHCDDDEEESAIELQWEMG